MCNNTSTAHKRIAPLAFGARKIAHICFGMQPYVYTYTKATPMSNQTSTSLNAIRTCSYLSFVTICN